MRTSLLLFIGSTALAVSGSARAAEIVRTIKSDTPAGPRVPVRFTRYELGAYRSPRTGNGPLPATVVRATRGQSEDGNGEPVSASYAPLPASAELAAELAAQRQLTADLRRIKESMAIVEQQARAHLEAIIARSEETAQGKREVEKDKARVRELESQLRERLRAVATPSTAPRPEANPTAAGRKQE